MNPILTICTIYDHSRLSLALFLSPLETTIVATSLLKIAEAFHSYNKASWIVVSYMLTYTGMMDRSRGHPAPLVGVGIIADSLLLVQRVSGHHCKIE